MKAIAFIAMLTSTMRVCGSDDPPPPPTTGAPQAASVEVAAEVELPAPSHGGHVVVVEERPVEVVVQDDGEVHAWVLHPEPPPPGFQMVVHVHGHDGGVHPVQMTWYAETGVWGGRLVEVRPAPGPVEVQVAISGRVHRSRIARVHVVRPRFSVFVDAPRPHVDVDIEVDEGHHHRGKGIGHIRGRGRGHHRHGHGHVDVDVHVRGPAPPPPPHFSVRVEGNVPHPPAPHVRISGHGPRPPTPHVRVRGGGHVGGHGHVRVRGGGRGMR